MEARAYAKINLCLKIKGKRPDGYHELETLMHSVPLCDTVSVSLNDSGIISVSCSDARVPCDEHNTAYKAAKEYISLAGKAFGADIHIDKKIPLCSGFGGSSTDGAAVLLALERALGALGEKALFSLAAKISADMPFCLAAAIAGEKKYKPYCALCKGIGEIITEKASPISKDFAVLAVNGGGLGAGEMYAAFDSAPQNECKTISLYNNTEFYNDFEAVAKAACSEIAVLECVMNEAGAEISLMSGSGSGVFALFSLKEDAEACARALKACGAYAEEFSLSEEL